MRKKTWKYKKNTIQISWTKKLGNERSDVRRNEDNSGDIKKQRETEEEEGEGSHMIMRTR